MADKSKLNDKKASEIEKIDTTSLDLAKENLEKFKEIFPLAFSEDKLDIEKLKNFLGEKVINEYVLEKYGLNWAGKSQAFKAIRIPSTGTLVRDHKGVDEDNSENIFIEGDNLEVLKLLQKHYFNQIKMIYIDPPYNTGKDFVYKDNWTEDIESYYKLTGQTDENGIKMQANTEKNGRFHSDWLTMMYPRLFLARNLLKDDGVIFVSIDDNEVANLRLIMDEIFGEENFVGEIAWQNLDTIKNDAKYLSNNHEYILCYSKNLNYLNIIGVKKTEKQRAYYKNLDNDERGDYLLTPLNAKSGSSSGNYEYIFSNGVKWKAPQGTFPRFSKNTLKELEEDNRIYFSDGGIPQKKTFWSEVSDRMKLITFWDYKFAGSTRQSNKELAELLERGMFDNPKPVSLLKIILDSFTIENDIILDFFAGSGTTAHAVMDLNAEDGGNRKWISVQLPELTDEKSEAYKAGYKTISEISRERIKRAGEKIKKEYKGEKDVQSLDLGFKTLTLKNSNYRMWQTLTDENTTEDILAQAKLFLDKPLIDGYKETDVVEEIILKEGFDLNSKVVKEKDMYVVSEMDGEEARRILITFAKSVNEEMVEKLKLKEADIFICLDSALTDSSKTNLSREKFNLKVI